MDKTLAHWHDRLAEHFAYLRTSHGSSGGDRPIFALEHGLEVPEIQALATAVRDHVAGNSPSRAHALAWVVYAAEFGYRYSGDEYWQTFEDETPGWTTHGDRYWIRDCFRSFQKQYGGAQPSGAWAKHFSIICWPITHAILPRDLQRQLARILYELRHSFSAELFKSPATLGEFIAARSWSATSRFQNFAQEPLLVGQIATALLLEGEFDTPSLIHSATLHRIGEDLDRERQGREWLLSARRAARERARIRGLAPGWASTSAIVRRPDEARAEVAALGIEPRLVLRPVDAGGASWQVSLEIPDLSHLLLTFPRTREILTGARCTVAGAAGRPLARGFCLHGPRRVALVRWPRTDEVLLQFDTTDSQLEYLLRAECLLRPGASRLFRIASDGLAYESRTMRVRPGQKYIILSANAPVASSTHARPIDLQCDGVHGALLALPAALTVDWEDALRRLGLGQAKVIEVWPAGLAAVVWDGEGHGEWLASEQPCLAIRSDHSIEAILVSMRGTTELSLELTSITPGAPVFVELPPLPVGLHTIRVCGRTSPEIEPNPLGDLNVVVRIREARPWLRGVSPHGPLIMQIDPAAPTLEQLWEGRCDIDLRGPAGRKVRCIASLFERDGDPPMSVTRIPPLPLPIAPSSWKPHFEKHFRETKQAQGHYDAARICQLEFTAEELGAFTVRCDREFTPLRWAVRRQRQGAGVRLIDDSGDRDPPTVFHFNFETPAVRQHLPPLLEYEASAAGGLYVAQKRDFTAAVIVAPTIRNFADLRCSPQIDAVERSPNAVISAVELAGLWGSGKSSGNLLSVRNREVVLRTIIRHILLIIGGERWAAAERDMEGECDRALANLKGAVSRRRDEMGIAAALTLETDRLAIATAEARISRLAQLAISFRLLAPAAVATVGVDSADWLAELALRLASEPTQIGLWAGHLLYPGVTRLMEVPTVARAARFLILATDNHLQSQVAPGELYAGWSWT